MAALDCSSLNLSDSENEALEKFKILVADIHRPEFEDYFYLRWLVARGFDLNKAEKMLRQSLKWREEKGMDKLVETYQTPEVILKYVSMFFPGFDRVGSKIWYVRVGHTDYKGLFQSIEDEDLEKAMACYMEKHIAEMKERNKKAGRVGYKIYYIMDMQDFGLAHLMCKPAVKFFMKMAQSFEANCPELMKKSIFINAPKVFSMFWSIVRPFLHEATVNKCCFYGQDGWQQVLLQDIDASELPVHLGGTKVGEDGNPFCARTSFVGGDVPREYFKSSNA